MCYAVSDIGCSEHHEFVGFGFLTVACQFEVHTHWTPINCCPLIDGCPDSHVDWGYIAQCTTGVVGGAATGAAAGIGATWEAGPQIAGIVGALGALGGAAVGASTSCF